MKTTKRLRDGPHERYNSHLNCAHNNRDRGRQLRGCVYICGSYSKQLNWVKIPAK